MSQNYAFNTQHFGRLLKVCVGAESLHTLILLLCGDAGREIDFSKQFSAIKLIARMKNLTQLSHRGVTPTHLVDVLSIGRYLNKWTAEQLTRLARLTHDGGLCVLRSLCCERNVPLTEEHMRTALDDRTRIVERRAVCFSCSGTCWPPSSLSNISMSHTQKTLEINSPSRPNLE